MHPNSRKAAQKHLELLHDDKKAMHIMTRDLKWKPQRESRAAFPRTVAAKQTPAYDLSDQFDPIWAFSLPSLPPPTFPSPGQQSM
jgi:hypothetical protein